MSCWRSCAWGFVLCCGLRVAEVVGVVACLAVVGVRHRFVEVVEWSVDRAVNRVEVVVLAVVVVVVGCMVVVAMLYCAW